MWETGPPECQLPAFLLRWKMLLNLVWVLKEFFESKDGGWENMMSALFRRGSHLSRRYTQNCVGKTSWESRENSKEQWFTFWWLCWRPKFCNWSRFWRSEYNSDVAKKPKYLSTANLLSIREDTTRITYKGRKGDIISPLCNSKCIRASQLMKACASLCRYHFHSLVGIDFGEWVLGISNSGQRQGETCFACGLQPLKNQTVLL